MLEPFPLNCKRIGVALKQVVTCGLQTFVPDYSWGKLFTAQPFVSESCEFLSHSLSMHVHFINNNKLPGSEPSLQYRSHWNIPPYCMARHNEVRSRLFLSFWCCRDAVYMSPSQVLVLEEFFTCPFRACKTRGDQSGTGHVGGIGPQVLRALRLRGLAGTRHAHAPVLFSQVRRYGSVRPQSPHRPSSSRPGRAPTPRRAPEN